MNLRADIIVSLRDLVNNILISVKLEDELIQELLLDDYGEDGLELDVYRDIIDGEKHNEIYGVLAALIKELDDMEKRLDDRVVGEEQDPLLTVSTGTVTNNKH